MPSAAPSNLRAWWPMLLITGLSLSIGWGIRGNYGHEAGAMIAGALGAMAAVILSRRADWWRRIAYFGIFGAVGWCFGGTISYMQVISYTHSGHTDTVIYGFACLFIIGFLWGFVGGAGTALPAFLTREKLTEFFLPVSVIFGVLIIHSLTYDATNVWLASLHHTGFTPQGSDFRQNEPLYWFDTDWTSALLAIVVVLVISLIRRKIDGACSLILHMCVGWWVGFLVLTVFLGLRMTPPRGDSWAGSVGLVGGMLVYFQRNKLSGVTFASLVTGFFGGLGFACATLFKLIEMKSGRDTNWHSILEQTYGLINGIGCGAAMLFLINRAPKVTDDPPVRRWTDWYSVAAVLLLVTYLNLCQNIEEWVKHKAMPEVMIGISAAAWFNMAYLAFSIGLIALLIRHTRRPLEVIPTSWLGKAQWLYLVFLWIIVIGNFGKALVGWSPQRLVTEGVIHLNAVICTVGILLAAGRRYSAPETPFTGYGSLIRKTCLIGIVGGSLFVTVSWGITRALYGDTSAPYSKMHIRFGPDATAVQKIDPSKPHP
jgi:hypothetical protein